MDEYIKREDAMKALDEHRLSHTMSMHGDMEMLIEYRDGVIGAMNALSFVPTADVVPKSEVARLQEDVVDRLNEINEGLVRELSELRKQIELDKRSQEIDKIVRRRLGDFL